MQFKESLIAAIVAGGTSQEAAPQNKRRVALLIQNNSDTDLWVRLGKSATAAAPSLKIDPGDTIFLTEPAPSNSVHVFGVTTGKSYSLWEA